MTKNTLPDGTIVPNAVTKVANAIWDGVKSLTQTTTGWSTGAKIGVPAVLKAISGLFFKEELKECYAPVLKYTVVAEVLETMRRIDSMRSLLPHADQVLE